MSKGDPIDLLFGGMEKLGPGSDAETRRALRLLPTRAFRVVVDAGCGTGRQTLVLAKELRTRIHAVDTHAPFLAELRRRAGAVRLDHLVETHCMDMKDIPDAFPRIDLLWSEGAAYSIGFAEALTRWAPAIVPGGCLVASELAWLREPASAPETVRDFFRSAYPAMRLSAENVALAEEAGYAVLATFTLPRETWVEGYYDVLAPRARALLHHREASVRDFARETLKEIEIFAKAEESYGYVFYVLRRG